MLQFKGCLLISTLKRPGKRNLRTFNLVCRDQNTSFHLTNNMGLENCGPLENVSASVTTGKEELLTGEVRAAVELWPRVLHP